MLIGGECGSGGRRWREQLVPDLLPHPTDPYLVLVPLSGGLVAVIDKDDASLVSPFRWRANSSGYAERIPSRTRGFGAILLHRLIVGDSRKIDHADGDGFNCRRGNLRAATDAQNQSNRVINTSSRNRFKGVRRPRRGWQWHARIIVNGKQITDGDYETEEEAALAYDRLARTHFGEFACLNFPKPGERSALGKRVVG